MVIEMQLIISFEVMIMGIISYFFNIMVMSITIELFVNEVIKYYNYINILKLIIKITGYIGSH